MLIIAQNISEKAEYRERIREIYLKYSIIESKASKKAAELDEKKVYNDYYESVSYTHLKVLRYTMDKI